MSWATLSRKTKNSTKMGENTQKWSNMQEKTVFLHLRQIIVSKNEFS